jgi:hypothetical protein
MKRKPITRGKRKTKIHRYVQSKKSKQQAGYRRNLVTQYNRPTGGGSTFEPSKGDA